jgi:hypothetical protein
MTYVDRDYDSHPLYVPPNLGTWTMVIGSILTASRWPIGPTPAFVRLDTTIWRWRAPWMRRFG